MLVKLIVVGKNKRKWLLEGEAEFLKRLKKFAKMEIVELSHESNGDVEKIKRAEGDRILSCFKGGECVVLLSARGERFSSREFAEKMAKWENIGGGNISFIIGGSYGVSDEVRSRADAVLSFSDMTMLHEMVRVFLLEQIYRGFAINQGSEYHKGV